MVLGYQRPLQATDLWKLPDDKASLLLSAKFLEHLKQRQEKARVWNETHDKKRHGSVAWALNDTLTGFWSGGLFKVVGDTAQLMAPLIIKQIIRFSQEGMYFDMELADQDSRYGKAERPRATWHQRRRRHGLWPAWSHASSQHLPAPVLFPVHEHGRHCAIYLDHGHLPAIHRVVNLCPIDTHQWQTRQCHIV
jgi:hypothetical protein